MDAQGDLLLARGFVMAVAIGVLIGIEREKRRADEGPSGVGGLRTFILLALLGALAGWMTRELTTPWLLVAAIGGVSLLVAAGYLLEARADPRQHLGLTTEVAALIVPLLGALAMLGYETPAAALGVVTAATLANKQPLHGLVARLGWDDVYAGLRLAVATFVILPLLPDRAIDPWGALNPWKLWVLVILISSLSLVGYVASRWLGTGRAAAVTGLTGGLVSSTAVTLSFARESRDPAHDAGSLAAGILLAWVVMFARVLVIVGAADRDLLALVAPPMVAMAAGSAAAAFVCLRGASARDEPGSGAGAVPLENPFSLMAAMRFAAFFAAVLLVVAVVRAEFPGKGVVAVAALAGLTDVDAITLSVVGDADGIGTGTAMIAIVVACLSNTAVKTGLAALLGSAGLRWRVGVAAMVVAGLGVGGILHG